MNRSALTVAALLLATLTPVACAQYTSGDIRNLSTPDAIRGHTRFTARCVAPNGELYLQRQRNSDSIDVYSSVSAFMSGSSSVRTVNCANFGTPSGNQMTWVNGVIYTATTTSGGNLARYDPMTGVMTPSSIPQGTTSPGWGGGAKCMLGCDGNYLFVHRDSSLDVYDLNEVLLRTVAMPGTPSNYGTSIAAGGYYYPISYPGQCMITQRINGATGAIEVWSTDVNVPCSYQVCASFDYFFNRMLLTGGNAPGSCADNTFLWNDVLQGGPEIRTVTAAPAVISPGQTGIVVSYDVENTGMNALTVTATTLGFTDAMGVDLGAEYTVVADPMNPTSIAPGATEIFSFTVDASTSATLTLVTVDGDISTIEAVTMATRQDQTADTPDTWDVLGASPQIRLIDAVPAAIAPGTTGHVVTMTVENVGLDPLDVTSENLQFFDSMAMDVSSDYLVVPNPFNPTMIAIGATEAFTFLVGAHPTAMLGTVTIDGEIVTVDQVSLAVVFDVGADTPDTWDVQSAEAEIRTVDALPMTVSQGGSGYQIDVTVENSGLAPTIVAVLALTFTGSADRTGEYTVMADAMNPGTIPAGTVEAFSFSVDVDPAATIETILIDAAFVGLDSATGALITDADADVTDTWDVIVCAVPVCGDCNGDGVTSILDALQAAQHAAGLITLTGLAFSSCNVIGVSEPAPGAVVDVIDALTLAQAAAGVPVALTCC